MLRVIFNPGPESPDIHGQGILIYKFPLTVPHMLQDLLLGEYLSAVLHEVHKKLIFYLAAPDLFSVFVHFA